MDSSARISDAESSEKKAAAAPPRWQFWRKHPKKEEEPPKYPPVSYWQLFRYSSTVDKLLLLIAIISAVGHGSLLPILTIIFGRAVDGFGDAELDVNDPDYVSNEQIVDELSSTTNLFLYVAFVAFVLSLIQLSFSIIAANRIGNELRHRFFDSLIAQDADFYDDAEAGALTNLVVNDINLIQSGVGDRLATAVQYLSTFVIGIIVGFVYGPKLTAVVLAVTPVLVIAGAIFGNLSADATGDGLGAYGKAGAVASEVLGLIRTVTAFGAQKNEIERYEQTLKTAFKSGVKAAIASGLGLGTAMLLILCTYGLAFWYGSTLVPDEMSVGDVLLTFFAITLGANSLGTAGPSFKAFAVARAAAPRVFEIIERKSNIDPRSQDGIVPDADVRGEISFDNVDFNYRKRITEDGEADLVLDNFSLTIPASASEAFVGKSGSGKSTIAKLIQRSYDPLSGSIKLDGIDLTELNVQWLRSKIGVVSQMPSLFMLSIKENIALGAGMEFYRDEVTGELSSRRKIVSDEEIIHAAKMANAHNFISKLPEGYDTMLGERGAMLSGGQKQRVCIARALVKNPKILLLDESTAALDTASERIVQDALDKAAHGRTTVTIAHRLSTVMNADNISGIQAGRVVERGAHSKLLLKEGGFYKGLWDLQKVQKERFDQEKAENGAQEVDTEKVEMHVPNDISVSKTKGDSSTKAITGLHDGEDEGGKQRVTDKGLFWRTLKLNAKEWPLMLVGIAGSILAGVIWPVASIVLIRLINIMIQPEIDEGDVRLWSLMFVVLGGASFVGNGLQHGALGISGELLTLRLRSLAFRSLLRQEMGYFDKEENSLGALTGRLSSDAGAVKGLTGDLFGIGLNVIGALVSGLIISFIACWRVTLVVLAIMPGIILGGYFEMQSSAGLDSSAQKDFAGANRVAAEAVDNVGTVRNLGLEGFFIEKYNNLVGATVRRKQIKAGVTGLAFGFSEFCQYLIWFATFKAGARFVSDGHCEFDDMLLSSMAILFAAITLGNVAVFAPDVGASKLGATNIYRLLDRQSEIDPTNKDGAIMDRVYGNIKASDVYFEYPRRPDVRVLRGMTVEIEQAKTLALVGTSGHGKSTIISLLERFYSIRKGVISIDGQNIAEANLDSLRSKIGLVSQEPELFNRSVFDNIAYGAIHDDGMPITMSDVVAAAKLANAHDFIQELPQGYDTPVGARGDAISGGQRQRVAIARSLLRKPPVLLLDEATSALDSASEKLVQEALDRASEGRTTVVVAHRLSTIRNADVIAVVKRGRIVESGTHEQLLRKNGAYAKLVQHQLSDV